MNDLSSILREQEKLGVNTRAYSYTQFKNLAMLSPEQTKTSMFPDLAINKYEKREMIKSLLKYNPNKPQETKKLKVIEMELKSKFMRKNQSEQRFQSNQQNINSSTASIMINNEQSEATDRNELIQQQLHQQQQILEQQRSLQESNSMPVIKNQLYNQQHSQQSPTLVNKKKGKVLYEILQNQFKDYVVGGQSNYKFYAQKKLFMQNARNGILSPQNFSSLGSPLGQISNLKTTIAPTDKAKKFIFDKSSMNKSTQKLGIHLPSPLVFKNQIGLLNQSELKRYENVIGKLQQLALRLDLNKNELDQQRPILRNFVELHQIQIPLSLTEELEEVLQGEEKIIRYVEGRKFLEVNDVMKQLKSIEDHFEFAIYGSLRENIVNNTLDISKNLSINQTQNLNFMIQPKSSLNDNQSKMVYNEGCGIALVNEKMGKFDTATIQYFEIGISLKKVLGYMKVVADIKNYVILEGNLLKVYKFQEDEDGKGKWVILNVGQNLDYRFDSKTLYAISAYQNLTHN